MSTITVNVFKDAYVAALRNRPGLAGVTIYDADETASDVDRESIIIGDWETDDEWHAMGGRRLEVINITCNIVVRKPDTAKAARDRAVQLLTEAKDELLTNPTVGGVVKTAFVASHKGREGNASDGGRECEIEFIVTAQAAND